ncbi:MAG: glycosyltransferase [Myroides sp.]|nr:glycosyltransferase [Myroides sp.]
MKVVHVIEALGGGVYTYFKGLSHFMGQEDVTQKIETFIIYSAKRKEIIPENIRQEFSKNVTMIELDMEREFNPSKDLKATFQLRNLFLELKPDVIHLHSSKAGVIGRWANFLTFKKIPVFYTPHGYAFLRLDISNKKRSFYKFVEQYTQMFFGGTTIACGDTEFEIAKSMGKSRLVRNGIDFPMISKKHISNKNEILTFGIVGRITAQKNPKLFNEIALRYPNFNFIWIGDGELRNEITAKNIQITGWFYNTEDVYSWINKTDVFLQTSLWEGLPLAVLEAMALQKPIVAKNVIGNKDIVKNNVNGFLFDSIDELDAIFKTVENRHIELGKNSFLNCEQNFDMNKNFKVLTSIYLESVLK